MPKSLPRLQNRKGVYYYRRRVPLGLVEKIGKPIIQFSLNTSDRKQALKLRSIHDVRWDSEFDAAQKAHRAPAAAPAPLAAVQPSEIARVVCDYVRGADAHRAKAFLLDPPQSEAERRAMRDDADMELSILTNLDDSRSDEFVHALQAELFNGPVGGATVGALLRQGLIEVARRRFDRAERGFEPNSLNALLYASQLPAVSFQEAARRYLDEVAVTAKANDTSQKWVAKQIANVATLAEIVGEDTPIAGVNYDVCQRVRVTLSELPAHRNKLFPGLALPEAISRAQDEDRALLSPTTQQQYLDTLRGILILSVKRGVISTNPAEGIEPLKRDMTPASQKRHPFRPEQLTAFFNGNYYTECAKRKRPYETDPEGWRFWLPLLCLFLGLRPNEACQMSASDVKITSSGTPYLDIVEGADDEADDAGKSLKTLYSRRKIPLHPELVRMGFMEFVTRRHAVSQAAMLFDGLKPTSYGNHAKYPLRRFRETFLPDEITLEKRQSFYSFRHNFRDACRAGKIGDEGLQALGAWSQGKKTSDAYGDASNPDFWREEIAKIFFAGLDLSHLYVQS